MRFAQVDVFSPAPGGGNPVAVVLEADALTDAQMQAFARWTNLSETTFVLAPTREGADYRVRIFTPSRELAFAGHPTLGTAHAVGIGERGTQECAAGLVELRRIDGRLAFAAPPLVRSGPVDAATRAEVVRALGAEPLEVVWAENGPAWVLARFASADEVLALRPVLSELDLGAVGPDGRGGLEVRAFFPQDGAMLEDPVTGSLNAGIGQWGIVPAPYVARQGTALGRTGRIHVSRDAGDAVWVAGDTHTVIAGEVRL